MRPAKSTLIGTRKECTFFLLWVYRFPWQFSTRLRKRIAPVFQCPPGICPRISQRKDCADEKVWLEFFRARVLCCLGCLLDAAQLLWSALVKLVPKLSCPFEKSLQIPAAWRPVIRNPTKSFTVATALLSPPFFGLLLGCSSTFQCGNEHSAPNLHPNSHTGNWHSGGCTK